MSKYKNFCLKIICCLLMLIVAICFCACAQVNASTIFNDDGSIDELATITLDRQKFIDAGYDYNNYLELQEYIASTASEKVNEIISNFNAKVMLDIKNQANWRKLSKTKNTGVWVGDSFKIGLHFEDYRAYKFYYGITDETSSEPTIEKHFFYDKVISKGYTMYASYNSLYQQLYNEFHDYFSVFCPELLNEKCELTYTYILDYRREKIGGKYYHTWKLAEGETDKVITIYYNLANRSHCILACILIGLAVCAILLLIGFAITKVKAKKKKQNN